MIESLGLTISVFALCVAGWAGVLAVADRSPHPVLRGAAIVLELAAVAQALNAFVSISQGDKPDEMTVVVAYLLISVGLIPLVTGPQFREQEGRWQSAALAVGCVVLIVVNLRLHGTWSSGG